MPDLTHEIRFTNNEIRAAAQSAALVSGQHQAGKQMIHFFL